VIEEIPENAKSWSFLFMGIEWKGLDDCQKRTARGDKIGSKKLLKRATSRMGAIGSLARDALRREKA
jgi:hypothetical protein